MRFLFKKYHNFMVVKFLINISNIFNKIRPEINEISKVLFHKSNGRLCKDLQSPRINYFELMRIGSPRGKSERRKDQGSI